MASFLSAAATATVVLSLLVVPSGAIGTSNCNIQCWKPDPVCGANGVTYGCGPAEAECKGVEVVKKGPCDGEGEGLQQAKVESSSSSSSSCNIQCLVYDPVCGDDGVTYGCGIAEAKCHKIEVVKTGPCDGS